jgi:hypothetical protein
LSEQYTPAFLNPAMRRQIGALISSARKNPARGLPTLFSAMRRKQFLQGGDEMFAQRGHSYWRSEQITDPLEKLKQERQISDQDLTNKQRFMSLGSCGGVKAYTRLTKMFLGHIDILATIGTGIAIINDPYNRSFFEIVAKNPSSITWKDMTDKSAFIFAGGRGADYLQPGSLTAILHKILDEEKKKNKNTKTGTASPKDR